MSQEYIDTLITWLKDWRQQSTSFCVFQFLSRYDIAWCQFKQLMAQYPKLAYHFDTTLSWLADRWYNLAMNKKDLPKHQAKLLEYYIQRYDLREWEKSLEARKEVAREETASAAKYVVENWARDDLSGIFAEHYEKNGAKH